VERRRWQPLVVLPAEGELAGGLRAAGVEVLIRPRLAVLRRGLTGARGLAALTRCAASDARALTAVARHRRVAVVHSNTSVVLGGAAAAAAARLPHVWHVREYYAGRFGRAWPMWRRVLLHSGAALACVSEATARQFALEAETPLSPRVRVLHDGLAVEARRARRGPARAALGLDPAAPVVAVLGRISDWKGQDVLVRALALPPLRERGAVALLAGGVWPGAEKRLERVLELANSLGVEDRLALVGFRDDIHNVYGAADVVAVPSTAPDPLPNSALEAAAAGCAVVAAAHGGLVEIFRDGVSGRLVVPGDAAALARCVGELLDDPAERGRLGAAAAADVRSRFAPERLLHGVETLWSEVLGE
jgi:glycosyltransferase involved in cell wall biosynthesis